MSYWEPRRCEDFWIGSEWVNYNYYEIGTVIHDELLIKKYKDLKWEDSPIKLN